MDLDSINTYFIWTESQSVFFFFFCHNLYCQTFEMMFKPVFKKTDVLILILLKYIAATNYEHYSDIQLFCWRKTQDRCPEQNHCCMKHQLEDLPTSNTQPQTGPRTHMVRGLAINWDLSTSLCRHYTQIFKDNGICSITCI